MKVFTMGSVSKWEIEKYLGTWTLSGRGSVLPASELVRATSSSTQLGFRVLVTTSLVGRTWLKSRSRDSPMLLRCEVNIFSKCTQFMDVDVRAGIPCSPLIVARFADVLSSGSLIKTQSRAPIGHYNKPITYRRLDTVGFWLRPVLIVDRSLQQDDHAVGSGASIYLYNKTMTRGSVFTRRWSAFTSGAFFQIEAARQRINADR